MKRNMRLLYLHSFLTDFRPDWPYQIIFFSQIAGSYTAAMAVLALEMLSAALFDIPTGVMSDKIGRRRTIAMGSLALALGIALYAFAASPAFLYGGAVCVGLSRCLFSGNNNALLFETLQAEGQQDRFGHYRAGIGAMFQAALCVSAFAGMPLSAYGLRTVFIVATAAQVLAVPVSLAFREPRIHLIQPQKSLGLLKQACIVMARNPKLMLLVTAKSIGYGAGEATFKFITAFVNMVWPVWAVGLYRGLNHACGFISFYIARRVVGKVKPFYIFAFSNIYGFLSSILALVLHNVVSPLLFVSDSLNYGPGEVASDSLLQKEFTDDQRATMGSLASSAGSVLFAMIAVMIGRIADVFGVTTGIATGISLSILCLPIYFRLFKREA
jgi:MFS family permease